MTLFMAALAEATGAFKFTDFNWALSVWTVVLFVIFFGVMTKFGWGPLLKIVHDREHSIREAVEGSERANAEAKALLEKHRQLMEDLTRERGEILKIANQEAEKLRADLKAQAKAEGERLVEKAREQIEREKGQAILELRGQVANLAVEAASKIVTSSLSPEAQKKLVSDFLGSLPRA
jgi:F-type H+-transporting ATPase subunit b